MIPRPLPEYRPVPRDVRREVEVDMDGWWCVRYGDALAWVEALSESAAVRRSLDLHPLGDWTDDAPRLVVFPRTRTPRMPAPTTTPALS